MKNKIIKQIAILILTSVLAIHGYSAMADAVSPTEPQSDFFNNTLKSPGDATSGNAIVTAMFNKDNLCIKDDDKNKITAVIEEPLDFGEKNDGNIIQGEAEVRRCVRTTVCTERDSAKEGKIKCISQLNIAGFNADNTDKNFIVTYTPVQVFLSQSGMDMLYLYISAIYRWGASMVGIVAVLVIVISGIQISVAGGDQTVVSNAKARIIQSLIGIAILFLSSIILYSINPNFFTI